MPGTKTITSRSLFLLLLAGAAVAQDYMPLQVGNQWVYRASALNPFRDPPIVVEVTDAQAVDGNVYFLTTGLASNPVYLRQGQDGVLYAYDPQTRREQPWVAFQTPEGGTFATGIDSCNTSGKVTTRGGAENIPIGFFSNLLKINYTLSCADAGIVEDVYLPYIGLVRRTRDSIGGPRVYDLIYARLGGVTVVGAAETFFSLSVDRNTVTLPNPMILAPSFGPPTLVARLTLRSTTQGPVTLSYPSSQEFDLVLRNAKGDIVYQWSANQVFLQATRFESFGPGERNRAILIPLADSRGGTLPVGLYTLEAYLTASPPYSFRAQVGIEIRPFL